MAKLKYKLKKKKKKRDSNDQSSKTLFLLEDYFLFIKISLQLKKNDCCENTLVDCIKFRNGCVLFFASKNLIRGKYLHRFFQKTSNNYFYIGLLIQTWANSIKNSISGLHYAVIQILISAIINYENYCFFLVYLCDYF